MPEETCLQWSDRMLPIAPDQENQQADFWINLFRCTRIICFSIIFFQAVALMWVCYFICILLVVDCNYFPPILPDWKFAFASSTQGSADAWETRTLCVQAGWAMDDSKIKGLNHRFGTQICSYNYRWWMPFSFATNSKFW